MLCFPHIHLCFCVCNVHERTYDHVHCERFCTVVFHYSSFICQLCFVSCVGSRFAPLFVWSVLALGMTVNKIIAHLPSTLCYLVVANIGQYTVFQSTNINCSALAFSYVQLLWKISANFFSDHFESSCIRTDRPTRITSFSEIRRDGIV